MIVFTLYEIVHKNLWNRYIIIHRTYPYQCLGTCRLVDYVYICLLLGVGLIAQRYIKEDAITKLCILGTPMILFDIWATIYNDALWLLHTPFTTILGLLFLFHGYYFRYNSIKKWLMLLALTMIVYIVAFPLVPLISMQKRTSTPPNTFINSKFPLVDIRTKKALHLNKGKTYYLDFFHTRCGYCIEKMPTIESLYQKTKQDTNVCVIAICDGRWDKHIQQIQAFPEIQ